jgi:pimeloyl-ACP methyl ester carboxylesterase
MGMDGKAAHSIWNAKNREDAFAPALKMSGPNGEKLLFGLKIGRKLAGMPLKKLVAKLIQLTPADLNYLANFKDSNEIWQSLMLEPYARGVDGYVDDRIADGVGWTSFEINDVKCPVLIIHGEADTIVNVINAHHTHELIPQSRLQLSKNEGHLSIISKLMNAVIELSGKKN